MRCINTRMISEAVGTTALVLLVLLPKGFCAPRDDTGLTDSEDCGESSERSANSRRCGGNPHHATEANTVSHDPSGPSRQQWIDRLR